MYFADTADVEKFATQLPDSFLQCREFGHSKRPYTAIRTRTGFERTVRCTRCKTVWEQVLDRHARMITSRPRYADGYLAKGIGRIVGDGRDVLRLESVERTVSTVISKAS